MTRRVHSVSVTAAGRALADRLPWPASHGALGDTVRRVWDDVDGLVLFAATGIAVRVVAPLLGDKDADPAVVCVDEAGRWAVALTGGHRGGANDLAREVAELLGATPIVTTATDAAGVAALDSLDGFRCEGDVAGVTRAMLDGVPVRLDDRLGWGTPLELPPGTEPPVVVVTDTVVEARPGQVVLCPPALIVGVGTSIGAPPSELRALAEGALREAGLAPAAVATVATVDRRRAEPAILALASGWGVHVEHHPPSALAAVAVPNPSDVVEAAVGTPSVAEAAALLSAGDGASLVVPKQRAATATVAVARRCRRAGRLAVVGLGPGAACHRTPAATAAVRTADVVIGYGPYVDLAAEAVRPGARLVRLPIGTEVARAELALSEAADGRRVALVCSGDAGVYAMASLVFERAAERPAVEITVVPGVTAAVAAAAALGAPLAHDHVAISLSDLLTPWEVIERRLRAAAEADLVVSLYNPRSAGRPWQLSAATAILSEHRPSSTPVGIVTDAGRPNETVVVTSLGKLDPEVVGMTTCVVVGASSTVVIGGRMVTPRGYRSCS